MAPPKTNKRPAQRKRNRKRKRRDVSSSSSSSDSSESGSEAGLPTKTRVTLPANEPSLKSPAPASSSSASSGSESESSDDSSSSESDSDEEATSTPKAQAGSKQAVPEAASDSKPGRKARVPSPPPLRNVPAPALVDGDAQKEQELRARFRQFWMGSVAEAFADDLNEIRKVSRDPCIL